jgi:bacterioferritin
MRPAALEPKQEEDRDNGADHAKLHSFDHPDHFFQMVAEVKHGEHDGGHGDKGREAIKEEKYSERKVEHARSEKHGRAEAGHKTRGEDHPVALLVKFAAHVLEPRRWQKPFEERKFSQPAPVERSDNEHGAIACHHAEETHYDHPVQIGGAVIRHQRGRKEHNIFWHGEAKAAREENPEYDQIRRGAVVIGHEESVECFHSYAPYRNFRHDVTYKRFALIQWPRHNRFHTQNRPIHTAGHKEAQMGNNDVVVKKLDEILEAEISGVVRYLHYSLMIKGPNRIPIVKFFRDQATEAFDHAALIGEKITSLGGHPSLTVQPIKESNKHDVMDILRESMEHEKHAAGLYKELLALAGDNIALEELAREMIRLEVEHIEEVEKMINR